MNLKYDNCPNCFRPLNNQTICQHCGYDHTRAREHVSVIEPFTLLNNRYVLGRVLGRGGFGVTYLAMDINSNRIYCIKEYMPSEIAGRRDGSYTLIPRDEDCAGTFEHGKARFLDEVKTLIKLNKNPYVVNIYNYFEENNTAYYVMEYLDGVNMKTLMKAYDNKLPKDLAMDILVTMARALVDIHSHGILHRDISPENIFITRKNDIKLIDFGSAKNYINMHNTGMSVLLKQGYAPPEQYSSAGIQGPWTDIYALASTFYNGISGEKLIDAMFIMQGQHQPTLVELNCGVSERTSKVIEKAMSIRYQDRYQTMQEFLSDLDYDVKKTVTGSGVNGNIEPQNHSNYANTGGSGNVMRTGLVPVAEIVSRERKGYKKVIPKNGELKIGRSIKQSDFIVGSDSIISRVHCVVMFSEETNQFVVVDKSANGTFTKDAVKMKCGVQTYVKPGDIIYLANSEYVVRLYLSNES